MSQSGAQEFLPYIIANELGASLYKGYFDRLKAMGVPDITSEAWPMALDLFYAQAMKIDQADPEADAKLEKLFKTFSRFFNNMNDPITSPRGSRASSVAGSSSTASTKNKAISIASSTDDRDGAAGFAAPGAGGQAAAGFKRPLDGPLAEFSRDHKVLSTRLNALNGASLAREVEQNTSVEGRVFSSTMLELCSFAEQAETYFEQHLRSVFALDASAPIPKNAELSTTPLHSKITKMLSLDEQTEVREAIAPCLFRLRTTLSDLGIVMSRAHKLFWIANHTEHCNWSVVSQIITRERWDAEQLILDPKGHKALTTWPEKIAAALTVCGFTGAVDKNGALIGPISPDARKLINAGKGQGRDRSAGYKNGGKGGAAGGAANKKGGRAASAQRGKGKSSKRSSQARKGDAGAGAPASAAALAAAAAPPL